MSDAHAIQLCQFGDVFSLSVGMASFFINEMRQIKSKLMANSCSQTHRVKADLHKAASFKLFLVLVITKLKVTSML